MHKFVMGICFSSLILLSSCSDQVAVEEQGVETTDPASTVPLGANGYPETMRDDLVETLHGMEVADPYRWLEDDVSLNSDVADWVNAQNEVTFSYLDTLDTRDAITHRMTALWDYEKFGTPIKRGNKYFYTYNTGLQNQSVLYVREGFDGEPRMLIDPNSWSDDGTRALASYQPSPDGSHIVYAVQINGTDWRTIQVLNVESGETLPDTIEWAKFTALAWNKDGTGFYYSRFPAPEEGMELQNLNVDHAIEFHALGTPQDEDQEIVSLGLDNVSARTTDDGNYLIISTTQRAQGPGNQILIKDISSGNGEEIHAIITGYENLSSAVGAVESTLYLMTKDGAPKNRIVAIDLTAPDRENWKEIIPESEHVIRSASVVGDKLIVTTLEDVKSMMRVYTLDGTLENEVPLPGIGTTGGVRGKSGDSEAFYSFASFNAPPTIYRYNTDTGESTAVMVPELNFNPNDIIVSQRFYPSKDGTMIPMFIIHRRDTDISKPTSTILYGYGGFNISILPSFSVQNLTWVDMGGVYVVANLRGGGEYGKEWHDAGKLNNKQNVFDDFAAGAEYLIEEGITSSDKIAIYGHSNGGLLVGATVNQRPDLFAAGLAGAGVMDMIRFDKFTAGRYWVNDYGKPDVENDFKMQMTYSPYHNIRDGVDYPAILVTAADHDDRVVPGHSFKYTAMLQSKDIGENPHMIRIETNTGHGAGMPTEKRIAVATDYWAFAAEHTGLTLPEGFGSN